MLCFQGLVRMLPHPPPRQAVLPLCFAQASWSPKHILIIIPCGEHPRSDYPKWVWKALLRIITSFILAEHTENEYIQSITNWSVGQHSILCPNLN